MSNRGVRLIEAMKIRGMQKQHALAYTLGVNESTITRWKNDGNMSLYSAIALCDALDISLDWFLVGYGHMDRHIKIDDASHIAITYDEDDKEPFYAFKNVVETMPVSSRSLLIAFISSIFPK